MLAPSILLAAIPAYAVIDCNLAGQYASSPIFVTNAVKPNILILFSNDHTNFYSGYNTTTYNDSTEYYGYFDPKKEYIYGNSNYFVPVGYVNYSSNHQVTASGRWSGNFLNWLTMCHADFVRKALMGGRRTVDSSSFTLLERGSIPNDGHKWSRTIADASLYTPFTGQQTFSNVGITVFRDADKDKNLDSGEQSYNVKVEVCNETVGVEENAVYYENGHVWKPEGIMQRFKDKAFFGLMTYSGGKEDQGGVMRCNIQDISTEVNPSGGTIANSDGIIGFINDFDQKGWDPIAEMYYEAIRYYKNLTPTTNYKITSNSDLGFQALCNQNASHMWEDPVDSWCQKNFIIIVNDEYPSRDSDTLPGSSWPPTTAVSDPISGLNVRTLTNTIGDMEGITGNSYNVGNVIGDQDNTCNSKVVSGLGDVRGICPNEADGQGSFYIGGLAYYALTNDLRSDYDDTQNIITYSIAFRATSSSEGYKIPTPPMNQLYLASKYGGFDDLNGNNQPDAGEWEGETETVNGVSVTWPKNFAHAESGKDFEDAMLKVLTDILKRSSSGTAAAVVTTSESGQGQLFQAYFEPYLSDGTNKVLWSGYLHALWIDAYGNLREDTDGDHALSMTLDQIVSIRFDASSNATIVDRYNDGDGDGEKDTTSPVASVALSSLEPTWKAAEQLGTRTTPRVIKTFMDKDLDGNVDTGEYIPFTTANATGLRPFLQVDSTEINNVINYIRGTEISGYRNRTLNTATGSQKYLLGDIIYSTPSASAQPVENFDLIYGDETYLTYYNTYKNRPTYVYVGANDGMLHAFYGGIFHSKDNPATTSKAESAYIEVESGKTLGEEAWAYIPKNVLPHLRWLTCEECPHIYYVDLKPKIVDARIFSDSWNNGDPTQTIHPYGWGTILVGGMRFGGPNIAVRDVFGAGNSTTTHTFKSAYFAIDITDPTNPQLLWEKTYDEMGYTLSYPSIIRVQNKTANESGELYYASPTNTAYADQKWLMVVGNGPVDFNGDPGGNGYVYVVNLETGALERRIQTPSLTGSAKEFLGAAASIDLNLNYDVDVIYMGSVIKPSSGTSYQGKMYRIITDSNDGDTDPDWNISNWTINTLIDAGKPITAAPGVAQIKDHIWTYFGTGRYIGTQDKTNADQQSFYGIKDPCSFIYGSCSTEVAESSLLNTTNIKVYETGYVTGLPDSTEHTWDDLMDLYSDSANSGFVMDLETPAGAPSERILVKPAVIGGLSIFTSFFPSNDICSFGGDSRLYVLYYNSGTAYKESMIGTDSTDTVDSTGTGGTGTDGTNTGGVELIKKHEDIGVGLPSQAAIHIGKEEGGRIYTQESTSAIHEQDTGMAQTAEDGFIFWREMSE